MKWISAEAGRNCGSIADQFVSEAEQNRRRCLGWSKKAGLSRGLSHEEKSQIVAAAHPANDPSKRAEWIAKVAAGAKRKKVDPPRWPV